VTSDSFPARRFPRNPASRRNCRPEYDTFPLLSPRAAGDASEAHASRTHQQLAGNEIASGEQKNIAAPAASSGVLALPSGLVEEHGRL
jgi:hypothetical protein